MSHGPTFEPDWASAPGETILDFLDERGMTPDAAGLTSELIRGETRIDATLARRLTEVLGGSEQFWLNRDRQYVEDCERLGKKPGAQDAMPEETP
jgi:plasmid maintenance system antidote protein VapI